MTGWATADALERLLDLLLRHHPAPGRVLEGTMDPPSVGDLVMEARGERAEARDLAVVGLAVEGAGLPQDVLEEMAPLEAALEAAGGWRGICAAVPRFKEFHPGTWDAVLAHVTAVRIGGGGAFHTGKGGPLGRIAERYGVSPVTLTRWRRRFPAALARVVLAEPVS